MAEAIQELNDFASGNPGPRVRAGFSPRPEQAPRIAFVMSGQGPQWWAMGRQLYETEPIVRAFWARCDDACRAAGGPELLGALLADERDSRMDHTDVAQPALLALQGALVELWRSWGIDPAMVVGHSVGEAAAAWAAGWAWRWPPVWWSAAAATRELSGVS